MEHILGPMLNDIVSREGSYEVFCFTAIPLLNNIQIDPLKASPPESVEENSKKIKDITEQVLDRILNSSEQCPTYDR